MKHLLQIILSGIVLLAFIIVPPALEAASPLHKATAKGKTKKVIQLISNGSDVNEKTKSGYTSLHIASSRGYARIARILVKNGADVNIKDRHGRTAADLAKKKNKTQVVQVLNRVNENKVHQTENNWHLTAYGALQSRGNVLELHSDWDTSSNLVALAASRKMFNFFKHIDFELEGQIVKHINGSDHWELNGMYVLRWITFPWNHFLHTSFAAGEGFSYTTSKHKREPSSTVRGLHYLMLELALALPDHKEWSLVGRVHHRSNIYGAIGPDNAISSNYIGMGIKYGFKGF
jgi:hypothetical protein